MAKRIIIKDGEEQAYPITTTENVFDESGIQLNEIILSKSDKDHEHIEYVKTNEVMPLDVLRNTLTNKSDVTHNHDGRYLTMDDLNSGNELVQVQIQDRDIIIETEGENGETITETVIVTAAQLSDSNFQRLIPNENVTIFLPEVSVFAFKTIHLYINIITSDTEITLPPDCLYNIDITDFVFEIDKRYELVFTNIEGWFCEIKVYQ